MKNKYAPHTADFIARYLYKGNGRYQQLYLDTDTPDMASYENELRFIRWELGG